MNQKKYMQTWYQQNKEAQKKKDGNAVCSIL